MAVKKDRWTAAEDEQLVRMHTDTTLRIWEIARRLGRSDRAVTKRLNRLRKRGLVGVRKKRGRQKLGAEGAIHDSNPAAGGARTNPEAPPIPPRRLTNEDALALMRAATAEARPA